MKMLRLAFVLPALIAISPVHAETTSPTSASAEQPTVRMHHHRLEHMIREFARRAEEKRQRETMLARR